MNESKQIVFRIQVLKKDGNTINKDFNTANAAIRALWRIRNVGEGYMGYINESGITSMLLLKLGRQRGVNIKYMGGEAISDKASTICEKRPFVKISTASRTWRRLPNRFNELQ